MLNNTFNSNSSDKMEEYLIVTASQAAGQVALQIQKMLWPSEEEDTKALEKLGFIFAWPMPHDHHISLRCTPAFKAEIEEKFNGAIVITEDPRLTQMREFLHKDPLVQFLNKTKSP